MEFPQIQNAIDRFNLQVQSIEQVPESNSAIVRILTLNNQQKAILKIHWSAKKAKRERQALLELKHLPHIPNLLDSFIEANGHALLIEYLDGVPISHPKNLTPTMAYQIGEMMAGIHGVKRPDFWGQPSWKAFLELKVKEYIANCQPDTSLTNLDKAKTAFYQLLPQVGQYESACLTHFDLRLGNILAKNGKVVGIIDFESSRGGSGDMDFYKLWREVWLSYPSLKSAMTAGYESIRPIQVDLDKVLPLYAIYNNLGGLAWCVIRGQVGSDFYQMNVVSLEKAIEHVG